MATHGPLQLEVSRRGLLVGGLGFSALGLLAVTGCAPANGGGGAGPTGSTTETEMTSFVFEQAPGDTLREILATFTKAEDVEVTTASYPYLQYLNQIVLKARAGNMAGVAHIDEEWMSTLASLGALKDLSKVVDVSLYAPAVESAGTFQGVRYAMPWTQSALGIVSNSGMLEQAGVSSIRSVDEFTDALRKIKQMDSSIVPYAPATNVEQLKDIIPWMWTFGSEIVADGEVTLGDDGSIEAVEYWKMLLDDGLIQAGLVRDDTRTLFAQQRAAFYEDAPQSIGIIPGQSNDPDIASKMVPQSRPTVNGSGDPQGLVWSQPLVAFDDSPATLDLLTYLSTNSDGLQSMFETTGQPPTTNETLQSAWFTSNEYNNLWNERIAATAKRNPFWEFPSASAAQTVLNEQVELALRGASSVSDALADAKDQLTALLADG